MGIPFHSRRKMPNRWCSITDGPNTANANNYAYYNSPKSKTQYPCILPSPNSAPDLNRKESVPLRRAVRFLICTKTDYLTVTEVMWGFAPSYQYRKPSRSTLSPTFRF